MDNIRRGEIAVRMLVEQAQRGRANFVYNYQDNVDNKTKELGISKEEALEFIAWLREESRKDSPREIVDPFDGLPREEGP